MEIFGAQDGLIKKEVKEPEIGDGHDDDRRQEHQSRIRESERESARPMTATATPIATPSRRVPPFPTTALSDAKDPHSPALTSPLLSALDNEQVQDDRELVRSDDEDPEEYGREIRWKTRELELGGSPSVQMEEEEGDSGRLESRRNGSLAMMDPLEESGTSNDEEVGKRRSRETEVHEVRSTRATQKRQVSSGARVLFHHIC